MRYLYSDLIALQLLPSVAIDCGQMMEERPVSSKSSGRGGEGQHAIWSKPVLPEGTIRIDASVKVPPLAAHQSSASRCSVQMRLYPGDVALKVDG